MNLAEIKEVHKRFGEVEAVRDLSFNIGENEIVGFLGPNGAGKSTTIEILTGQISRDSGEAEVLGMDPEDSPVDLRKRLGVLPEREDPPSFLTGNEYLDFVSDIRGEEIERERWIERMRLEGKMGELTRDLSKGERQKLMIIQSFFHDPELVFIDEPMTNLDPVVQEEVKNIFREFEGSVFLCTHNVSLAEEVCDRVLFLKNGNIIERISETGDLKNKFLNDYDY